MNEHSVKEFNQKYSPLLSELREKSLNKIVIFWKALNLIRQLLTLIILTTLNSFPTLQIQILFIFSLVTQCLILTSQPYSTKMLNILYFFNELSVSIYLYLALLLSDYLEYQFISTDVDPFTVRINLAWILTLLLCIVILVNCLYMMVMKIINVASFISRRWK
jgi:hypothetical protein